VTVALSGRSTMEQVEENLRTAETLGELTEEEYGRIAGALEEKRKLADLYCTGCGYCMPCPNGVNIPRIFELMNYHRVYGLTEHAQKEYRAMKSEPEDPEKPQRLNALACVECGECEPKCPQHIPIIQQLKETHEALGDPARGQ
jgi:predicted aldo/keto reductase-like oxidoreductase